MDSRQANSIATSVLAASSEVMRVMGCGLHSEIYKFCLYQELLVRQIDVILDYRIPVMYKQNPVNVNLSANLLVENALLVNVFSQEQLSSQEESLMKSALSLSKRPMGLILNFYTQNFMYSFKKITNPIFIQQNYAL